MSRRQKPYVFFVVDTPTGLCNYLDAAGNIKKSPISLSTNGGPDVSIQKTPDGWMNSELGFLRNARYYGMNRSFTIPQKLVDDAAFIVRSLMNRGRGIEVPLSMMIFRYNENPAPGDPNYDLYYKGQIDLPNHVDTAGEGMSVNLMEGGVMQLLKAYENTMIEIPCDGSIPENRKVNMDGMLFEDVFNYQVVSIAGKTAGNAGMPCVFISNEGDNAGIIHNDPTYDPVEDSTFPGGTYFQNSQNYLFSSARPVTVRIQGSVIFASSVPSKSIIFQLFLATSKTANLPVFPGLSHCTGLVPGEFATSISVQGTQVYNFDKTVTLDANEHLFLMMLTLNGSDTVWQLLGGSFTLTFASQFPTTTPWAITWFDLFRLIVQAICDTASKTGQTFNYGFDSQLLKDNLNLVVTSGDALRASGDPNYQRFYNAIQNNPNFPNINLTYSFGPVIKTCLADCFDSANAILNASLSSQILTGENETIFVESKGYVFNSSITNLDNGEVLDFKSMPATDLYFTLFKVGYEPQSDDQKAGKYAWNTTGEWQLPLKAIPSKVFEVISKYLTDPYLMEKLRSNIGDTSTTRNNSNNSCFVINTDPGAFVFDSFSASFVSTNIFPSNPDTAGNTNINLVPKTNLQNIGMTVFNGSYLSVSNDPSIFLFNQAALSAHSFNIHLAVSGFLLGNTANVLTGLPADSVMINLVINGIVIQSFTTTATGASTTIAIAFTVAHSFSYKDSIYLTCSTSVNATADIANCNLRIEDGTDYLNATGAAIEVDPGIPFQLLALPNAVGRLDGNGFSVVSWGFQYFIFNSILINHNFNVELEIRTYIRGLHNNAAWDVYLNGQVQHSETFIGTAPPVQLPPSVYSFNHDFQDGDILFMVGSAQDVDLWITEAHVTITSTQIKAYNLKRVQYENISGIPLLLGNIPGTAIPVTTGPGAPYNIEQLSPKRMLLTWGNYLRSILFDQIPGTILFSTLSKNQNLTTTYQGVTITENQDVEAGSLAPILFIPRYLTYKTRVSETFAKVMTGAANAHARNTYNGIPFFGFPWELKQKPTLNDMQDWKLLASPVNDITQLIDLNINGLNFLNMGPNSIFCSFLSPVQFVPAGQVLPPKYHTKSRNLFWFSEQVTNWINQNNYWQPWQNDDACNLQFITRDLTEVAVNLYACDGTVISTTGCVEKFSPAIIAPYHLWEVTVDLSAVPESGYYLTAAGGSGDNLATLISEGMWVKADWPETMLIEAASSANRQSMIFDTGYAPAMRIRGFFDNMFKQKYKGAFYTNQIQDLQILNAIPYEITSLWCGLEDGIPDYVHKKVARMLLLDGTKIEGEGFSINDGADWEETFIQGNPKKFQKIDIRPSLNIDGISVGVAGTEDGDTSMMISLDAAAFGPNAGNAGSPDPDIITVTINS